MTPNALRFAKFLIKVYSKSFPLIFIDALTTAAAKKMKQIKIQTSFNVYSHAKISILGTGVLNSVS